MENQCKVTVVDAPCGYGKTSFAIQYMKQEIFDSFIFNVYFELNRKYHIYYHYGNITNKIFEISSCYNNC